MKSRLLLTALLAALLLLGILTAVAVADELQVAVDPEGEAAIEGSVPEGAPAAGTEAVSWRYAFSSSSGTYTEITGGTVHGTVSNDDTSFAAIDIGFTFTYDGVDYTQVSIQSNGFIAMGASVSSSYTPLSTGSSNNVVAALGRDLQGNGTTSELMSLMEGTAPNRVFTVQWKDYKRYGTAYAGDSFDFQIKLYETSNRVEVVYGEFTAVYNAAPPTMQVGLRGASNADFHNRMTDATHFWADSLRGTSNASSMALTDTIYPASGLTYDWALATGPIIDPEAQSGSDCPGGYVLYEFEIINLTAISQSFTLDYTSTWTATGPAATGVISPEESEIISVTVHIPWAANTGDSDVLTVTVSELTRTATDSATATTVAGLGADWQDYANSPTGRGTRAPSVVYYDGKLYKIGGYNVSAQPWLDIYDIATDTWTQGADMPGGRYWINCEAISGKIYCAGGYLSSGQTTLYIYDIATNTWTTGANPLAAYRYRYASVQLGGKYYLIGGYAAGYSAAMVVYDPVADTWDTTLASMNVARDYFHAGVIGGKIYVAGGYNGSYLSSAEVYDPTTNTWTYIASMPMPWLNAADGVKHDRFLILAGGYGTGTGTASNGALYYDAQTDTWGSLPLLDHIIYGAEGDVDGDGEFWYASGRLYENAALGYSTYNSKLVQCGECVPVSNPDFTVDPANPRPTVAATFSGTADGSPTIDFAWDFGDGGFGAGQTLDYTYAATGTYTVVMTATNCDGGSWVTATHDVVVMSGPIISVDPGALESTQCPDTVMTYTLSVCNGGDEPLVFTNTETIAWLEVEPFSDTVAPGDCATVEVEFDSAGLTPDTYTGTLEIENNDIISPVVEVPLSLMVAGPPTNADFTWDPSPPGMNEVVTFHGVVSAMLPVDYTWDFGDGGAGSGQDPTHAYATYGDFTVTMTATVCGESDVATHTLTVLPCWSVLTEHFEGTFPPANWSVLNNGGTCVWTRNDAFATARPNYAGGDGFCADADADKCGSGTTMDTELRTMVLDLSGMTTATLDYIASYNWFSSGEFADTDISTDGGATWTNLLHWVEDHSASGPGELVSLNLTPYAGQTNVMIRFYYYAPGWDYWWEVDQVNVRGCYVEGAAPDIAVTPTELEQTLYPNQTADQSFNIANEGLVALNWTLDEGCGTPVDWLSLDPLAGTLPSTFDTDVTVSFDSAGLTIGTYETTVCVDSDDPLSPTVIVEVTLIVTGAAEIAVAPGALESTQPPDAQVTFPLTISNMGDAPLTWSIGEVASAGKLPAGALPIEAVSIPQGPATPAIADSGEASGTPVIGVPANPIAPDDIGDAWETMAPMPSARVFNAVVASGPYVYVIAGTSDAGGLTPTNTNFRYNTADNTWSTMAPMPAALDSIDGIAIGGMIYIPGSDPDNNTYVYDTAADTWSAIPANGGYAAPAQYQVAAIGADLYVLGGIIGGASTTNVWILDTATGTWSAGVPMQKSRTSFSAAAIGGNLYVAGGVLYPGFVPDMTAEMFNGTTWSYIAGVPNGGGAYTRWSYNADGMAPGALWLAAGRRDAGWLVLNHAGYYDVATDTWTDSPTIPTLAQGRVYMEGDVASDGYFYVIGGRDSAGANVYATNERLMVYSPDVPWLSEDPISGTVDAGLYQVVDVTFDSTGLAPGDYYADLAIDNNDPYNPQVIVPVTLTVGTLGVTVDPAALDAELCPEDTTVLTFSICNTGTLPVNWMLSEAEAEVKLLAPQPVPASITGQSREIELKLESSPAPEGGTVVAPPVPEAAVALVLDDGVNENNIGIGGTLEFIYLNRFTPDPGEYPFTLDEIQVYFDSTGLAQVGDDIILAVYENTSGNVDPAIGSNWLASFPTTVQAIDAWNVYDISTTPVLLNGPGDVLIGVVALEVPGTSYWPAAIDQTATQQRSWAGWWLNSPPPTPPTLPPDASWTLIDAYFPGNWMVRGYGETYTFDIPWLSEDPTSGTVAPGTCQDVAVTFDATGLTPGDYYANLILDSNDPDTPVITVPVSMMVWEPAAIADVTYVIDELEVTFDATATGNEPLTYAWDFDDGNTSSDEDPIHVYDEGGCYDVSLTVSNACGDDTWTEQICVCEPVSNVDFTWLPDMPVVGETVAFTATADGTPPLAFDWDFDDGTIGAGVNVTHVYTAAGDYVVMVMGTNCDGDYAVMTHTITVETGKSFIYLPIVYKNY